jgi:hypothetical protein
MRHLELFVHRQDGCEIKTVLTNVSERGCRLVPAEPLLAGEHVRIEIPRLGSIAAIIRWSLDGHAGAEFIAQSDVWEETAKAPHRFRNEGRRPHFAPNHPANRSNLDG